MRIKGGKHIHRSLKSQNFSLLVRYVDVRTVSSKSFLETFYWNNNALVWFNWCLFSYLQYQFGMVYELFLLFGQKSLKSWLKNFLPIVWCFFMDKRYWFLIIEKKSWMTLLTSNLCLRRKTSDSSTTFNKSH